MNNHPCHHIPHIAVLVACAAATQASTAAPSKLEAASTNSGSFLTRVESPIEPLCSPGSLRNSRCLADPTRDRTSLASDTMTADLPHLRLDIVLREMRNTVVTGTGIDSLGSFKEPWALFKIASAGADVSKPQAQDPAYGLPVPGPGATWSVPHANVLFSGINLNGCLNQAAEFDLTLDSSIYRISTDAVFGEVHHTDSVHGPGQYTFRYTITATDESGNTSDFVFSGDAEARCTAKPDLMAETFGDADGTMLAASDAGRDPNQNSDTFAPFNSTPSPTDPGDLTTADPYTQLVPWPLVKYFTAVAACSPGGWALYPVPRDECIRTHYR